jgi:hypothetical protein
MIKFNRFANAYTKAPAEQAETDWAGLCARLTRLTKATAKPGDPKQRKKELPAWTAADMTEAYNNDENTRALTALPIDVDTAPDSLIDVLEASCLSLFVYASPSDPNPDGTRRLRIVAELSRPIAPAEVEHARLALAEHLGIGPGQGVESAKAVSQVMFAGRLHGTPKRDVWQFDGEPLDVDALMSTKLTEKWTRTPKPSAVKALERVVHEDADERTAALLEAVAEHWEAPGEATDRRSVLRAFGGYLARRGWTDEQIAAVGRGLETERPERDRVALMVQCARATRASDGETGAGWSGLTAWDPDAAALIEAHAKDPLEPADFVGIWSKAWAAAYARPGSWVNRGRERAEKAAEHFAPPETSTGPHADYDWTTPDEPIDWYCKALGIAPSERKITLIAGDPGSGKGPLSQHLAVCFALGLKAFGALDCKQCNVGILDFEGARLSARRIKSHALGMGHEPEDLSGRIFLRDCDPGDLGFLTGWIETNKIEVLIVDSYMSAMSSTDADPNSPEYASLARALGALGIVVIVIAHARKPAQGKRGERPALGDVAGSYALGGMAATAIAVWNPDDDDRQLARIGCMRAPDEAFKTFDVRWEKRGTEERPIWTGEIEGLATKGARDEAKAVTAEQARDEKLTRVANVVIAHLKRTFGFAQTINGIAKDTGLHHRDVGAAIEAMARADMVAVQPGAKGGSAYMMSGDVSGVLITKGDATHGPPRKRFGPFSV